MTPRFQRLLCDYLRDEGLEVLAANNGAGALHQAHTAPPDVAIVDAMMPVMDARPMLDTWSQDLKLRTVPVVVVSAAPGLLDLAHHSVVQR